MSCGLPSRTFRGENLNLISSVNFVYVSLFKIANDIHTSDRTRILPCDRFHGQQGRTPEIIVEKIGGGVLLLVLGKGKAWRDQSFGAG